MLFQLDEGTARIATTDDILIEWSYLRGGAWVRLPRSALLVDETAGFQTSGVVAVAIGPDATNDHTAMPGGLSWLRAELFAPAESVARTRDVAAQAGTAVFAPEPASLSDYSDHLAEGLPAETITKLKPRVAQIRKVRQPFASFGSRQAETDAGFFERGSERLRHRARAVTGWDFERLVLERFDGIFKVKALPHSNATAEPAPGQLALVIIPDLSAQQSTSPLEPRAGETLMAQVRDYLASGIATPFADVHVIHPTYERVLVDAAVVFRPGFDPGFYAETLDVDLQRFLSPWAFEEGRDIVFGTRIFRSELLRFVEERPYVDYVTRFDLYHAFDGPPLDGVGFMEIGLDFVISPDPVPATGAMQIGTDFIVGRPVDAAISTRTDAILVSHPAHRIEPVMPGAESCPGVTQLGIGYMSVGLDFTVSAP